MYSVTRCLTDNTTYFSYQNINRMSTPRKSNDRAVGFRCLQVQEPENKVLAKYVRDNISGDSKFCCLQNLRHLHSYLIKFEGKR
jgi:hypothetical protein